MIILVAGDLVVGRPDSMTPDAMFAGNPLAGDAPAGGIAPQIAAESRTSTATATLPDVASPPPVRVLIGDAHPIVRNGLTRLFDADPGLRVCCEAESADQAVVAAEKWQADLAVVDLSFGGRPSTDVVRSLRDRRPSLRVVVFSAQEEALWAARALQAGACGYVMKREDVRTLLARVHQALRGETAVSEAVSSAMLRELTWDRVAARPTGEDSLGDRELQVLRLIGHGRGTKDIAADMHISVKTVDAHREHIKRKLGLGSGAELIRYAVLKVHRDGDALGGE